MQYKMSELRKLFGVTSFSNCKSNDSVILDDVRSVEYLDIQASHINSHASNINCDVIIIENNAGQFYPTLLFNPL